MDSETGNSPGQVREGYGKLRLLALPSSTTVPGPGQVQNKYDSDEKIATQLNLLNQADSTVIRGNLLTLPVGGGLLYVQPVYVQGTGSASYPVLRSVLTAFGDKVGFAPTLEESLSQLVADDSATTTQSGGGGTQPGTSTTPGDASTQLSQAVSDAAQAMRDADAAMSKGDWTAYGEAQTRLHDALNRAEEAQRAQGGGAANSSATPAPAPSAAPPPGGAPRRPRGGGGLRGTSPGGFERGPGFPPPGGSRAGRAPYAGGVGARSGTVRLCLSSRR